MRTIHRSVIALVAFVFLSCFAITLFGQGTRRPAAGGARGEGGGDEEGVKKIIKVDRLSALGKQGTVKTPEYEVNVNRVPGREEWGQITVEYKTAPEWIDELVFQHTALAMTTEDGKRKFSLYKLAVRYVDVERGDHTSTAFLRPAAVKRYGELVAVAVEISADGNVVAETSEVDPKLKMPEKWWKNPQVMENADVTVREGYLIDRSRSPFALINIDSYEVIK